MLKMKASQRKIVRERWRAVRPEIEACSAAIWSLAELPMMEYRSAHHLCQWLESHGFDTELDIGGMPTAFKATYGSPDSPAVGLMAEYDALPGQANRALPQRSPLDQRAGHACGHNQIAAANVGAAIAVRHSLEDLGLGGQIVVFGTPGEEILYGKVAMLDRGAFQGADVLLTSHADVRNGVAAQPCLAGVTGEFVFAGCAGHGGAARTQNALEAAELAVGTWERLRGHHFADASVEHVLRTAGLMPNITPEESRVWVYVRHAEYSRALEVYEFLGQIAQQAAAMTETSYRDQFIVAARGYLPNDRLADVLWDNLQIVGPPLWRTGHLEWMRRLSKAFAPEADFDLDRSIARYQGEVDAYSQDDGEVSWRIPLGRVNWAVPAAVDVHNWAATALSGSEAGIPGVMMASETIALATVEMLAEPSLLEQAQMELRRRVGESELEPPQYGGFGTFSTDPERFWDAVWE